MPAGLEEQFARRVGAMLVAEHEPGAPPAEGSAAALARAGAFFARVGGDAEPMSSSSLLVVFDHATTAVRAATSLHLGSPRAAEWRVGVHVGTVVMMGEPTMTVDAIERATALARVARVGTTAVMPDALPALGRLGNVTVERLENVELPGIPSTGVILIVPRWDSPRMARRHVVALLAGTAAVAGAGGVAWITIRPPRVTRRPLTLGVGPFRSPATGDPGAWMAVALRDGLNTQLSELSGLRVFSDDFMDFVMTREGLTTIELATRLGIEKIVSGTVVAVGDKVRVEARIVDVASGLFEGAYAASGREADFLALESEVVLGVIGKLGLELTAADHERLAAQRATDLDKRRQLFEVEGETEAGDDGPSDGDPGSWLWDRLGPARALAGEAEAKVMAFLEGYRRASEAADLTAVAAMYVSFSPRQRAALEGYYATVSDLRVRFDRIEVEVVGDEAVVSYTRNDRFRDVPTNRELHVSARVTKTLRRVEGHWRFTR